MISPFILSAVAAILSIASATSINVINHSSADICYGIEFTTGSVSPNGVYMDKTTGGGMCGGGAHPGFHLGPGQSVQLNPSADFNGPITAWLANGMRGARHEINFASPDVCWYDVDYQYGMSDSTLGPASQQPLMNGLPSLAGETDYYRTAQQAWASLSADQQNAMKRFPEYIQESNGQLTYVNVDIIAPQKAPLVVWFLQVWAHINGYVDAGAIASGNDAGGDVVHAADMKSWEVGTTDMVITAY